MSASAKKLCKENYFDKEVRNSNQSNGYRMINIDIFLSELSKYLICPNCNTKAVLKEKILYGLVSEFYVECYSCSTLNTFKSSSVIASSKDYEVNTRIIYAMRTVGLGFCGIKNFCTAMDLPPPVSQKSYERIQRKINLASHEVADDSMKNAAKEEVSASGSNEICVSCGGTWKTRGHTTSTDEEPMHHFCPTGDTSWCKYQKAVATNSASLFKHKNILPIAIMDEIKPIIAELSAPKLLK
ncbi:uncharacterized protein TNCV_1746021 [Trichonephila clavipes]|nr:uncharacterized protein TNCV_1746021 [Trichonephila clavipes]